MNNANAGGRGLLRLIGYMSMCVGMAWALQVLGFSGEGSAFSRFLWVMAAASIAGAGAGLVMASSVIQQGEGAPAEA